MPMFYKLDLKLRIALRVAVVAACCLVAATGYSLSQASRTAGVTADKIAQTVVRDLELQQDKTNWVRIVVDRFPDLRGIATLFAVPGLCIAYRSADGAIVQQTCNGVDRSDSEVPGYFAALYKVVFRPRAEVTRSMRGQNSERGEVAVSIDPQSLVRQAWDDTSRLLAVMGGSLVGLCILVYVAIARALRPTRVVLAGLERLAAGDLSVRLPDFDLAELSPIRNVFNGLAERIFPI